MGLSPTSNFNSAINLQFLKYISLGHVVVVKVGGNVLVVFCVCFVRSFSFLFCYCCWGYFLFRREGPGVLGGFVCIRFFFNCLIFKFPIAPVSIMMLDSRESP